MADALGPRLLGWAQVTVVQPNEDGSYWRKIVRNKMVRMKESRRVKAAKAWMGELVGEENVGSVLSSWGPYTSTIGQVRNAHRARA